ncbi:MAG: hypothetical protein R3E65_11060 [Steroidobacteraceae bacterium]
MHDRLQAYGFSSSLAGFFLTNALIAEFVGVKIFSLEGHPRRRAVQWRLLGVSGTLNFTAGVLLWPFVFIMTDVINEYYGVRGVRLISGSRSGSSVMRSSRPTYRLHWRRPDSGSRRTADWVSTTSSSPMDSSSARDCGPSSVRSSRS